MGRGCTRTLAQLFLLSMPPSWGCGATHYPEPSLAGPGEPQVLSPGGASRLSEKSREKRDSLTSLLSVRWGGNSLGKGV